MNIKICNLRTQNPTEIYDVRVDRTSILGNPFYMKTEADRDAVCNQYQVYFDNKIKANDEAFMSELSRLLMTWEEYGQLNLFCWCAPKRCHAETIKNYLEKTITTVLGTKNPNLKKFAVSGLLVYRSDRTERVELKAIEALSPKNAIKNIERFYGGMLRDVSIKELD